MSPHWEAISREQKQILPLLGKLATESGFYLGGGTAIALHLGHRLSVDFDWFCAEPLTDPLILAQRFRQGGLVLEKEQVAPGTLHAVVNEVRLSFLQYPYGLLEKLIRPEGDSFVLASLDDLACMKLAAAAQRGSRKDFIDIYALSTCHKPLRQMLELYKKNHSTDDIAHVLVGLAYFDNAEEEPMPVMIWKTSWSNIKRSISGWVREISG